MVRSQRQFLLCFRGGIIYVPVLARVSNSEVVVPVEPVFVIEAKHDTLLPAMEHLSTLEPPRVPCFACPDALLTAMNVRRYSELVTDTALYGVSFWRDKIIVYLHGLSKQGIFSTPPARELYFERTTTWSVLVEAILADAVILPQHGYVTVMSTTMDSK